MCKFLLGVKIAEDTKGPHQRITPELASGLLLSTSAPVSTKKPTLQKIPARKELNGNEPTISMYVNCGGNRRRQVASFAA